MSLDLLVKLTAIPLMLWLVHNVTASKTDQSLSELAVSVQYEALRDVAGTTYEESFYNADKSEEGLESNANDSSGYATRVSYFDYVAGEELAREQLLSQLSDAEANDLSIIDVSFSEGIEGYIDVLVAGGALIEEDGTFFENALWGRAGGDAGSYFSGLSGFGEVADGGKTARAGCKPYAQIQKLQSQLAAEQAPGVLGAKGETGQAQDKLVDLDAPLGTRGGTPPSPGSQDADLGVTELLNAVDALGRPVTATPAIAAAAPLDKCFIAQAGTVFDFQQAAIAPTKQMPNLAYYDYFFSTTETKANIEDGSANFFLFRKTEPSPEQTEKRRQLFESARQQVSKWNAF